MVPSWMDISVVYRENTRGWIEEYSEMLEKNIEGVSKLGFSGPNSPVLSTTLSTWWSLPNEIRKCESELTHFLANGYMVTPRNLDKSPKTIVTVHDLFQFYENNYKTRVLKSFHNKNLKKADKIVAVSEFTKQDLIERLDYEEENIEVIPSAIDKTHYTERDAKNLDLPENFILFVGNDLERKNLEFLVKMHGELSEIYEDLHLVFAGAIGQETIEKLKILAEESGNKNLLVFKDWVEEENMPELYSRAKVYVQPSRREGQGIPPVEAMACGTPPVVSNRTALPETVGREELVAELDIESFNDVIRKLIEDDEFYQEMKGYGKDRSNHFSKEKSIKRHRKLYNSLLRD